jgi:hypothetical protein
MIMAFRPYDLQEAFLVPGTHNFRVWGYGTLDALEEVLRPGYFAAASSLLQPGQLIYVSARRRKRARGPVRDQGPGEVHMALLMGGPGGGTGRRAERARGAPGAGLRLPRGHPPADHDCGHVSARGAGQARPRPPARQPHEKKRRSADTAGELMRPIGGHDGLTAETQRTQRGPS